VTSVTVRRLWPDDWRTLRNLRLAALAEAPEAFGSTYESAAARREEEWRRWPSPGLPLAAFVGSEAVGVVGAMPVTGDPTTAHLIAMWVAPALRGSGVGDELIAAVADTARSWGCRSVFLEVVADNHRAVGLYARNGFVRSREPAQFPHAFTMRLSLADALDTVQRNRLNPPDSLSEGVRK
jgi:ribosomal protein S18 acetylase RimI-like enzyme